MIRVEVSDVVFDGAAALAPLGTLGGGAVASFTGFVRDDVNDQGGVTAIQIEHYPAMTRENLDALVNEAVLRWSLLGCVLVHRVGHIALGEAIVLVGAAANHRAEALEACSYLIDRLKTHAPFWKKEYRADGSADWVEAKASDEMRASEWSTQ